MPDAMRTESLPPGQNPVEIGVGGQEFLGSGSEAGRLALEGFRRAGMVDESNLAERGGGEDVDPVEAYFAKNLTVLDEMGKFIEAQRKAGKRDDEPVSLGGQPLCTLGEYQKVYKAIRDARAKGDGRSVEEIICEARQPAPLAPEQKPEPQPVSRPGDWRESLPPEQRQRLKDKEQRWSQLQPVQLTAMQEKIATALSNWGLGIEWPEELQRANLLAEDGTIVLRALDEAVENRKVQTLKQRIDAALLLLPEVSDHIQRLQRELGLSSREAVIARLSADLQAAVSIGRNTDAKLFPPRVKQVLIQFIKSGNGTAT